MNSNFTLRFPRTSREAYGYQINFHKADPDRYVFIACLIGAAFLIGMMVGGAL
jgi:hypothetical protein